MKDKPAFPLQSTRTYADSDGNFARMPYSEGGMTLREHYAGLAMQGMLAAGSMPHVYSDAEQELFDEGIVKMNAKISVDFADALIARLEEE